ncbi:hypothetical protein EBZ35_07545 [bacterium]|nr:hypothetical protein [bacterium]
MHTPPIKTLYTPQRGHQRIGSNARWREAATPITTTWAVFFYHRQLAVPMLFIHSVSRKDTPQNNPGNKGTHEPWV